MNKRPRHHHHMKIFPKYFEAVLTGRKTFEWRKNDRDGGFVEGDRVTLNEWDEATDEFTGKSASFWIGFVFPCDPTHVVFSLIWDEKPKDAFGFTVTP